MMATLGIVAVCVAGSHSSGDSPATGGITNSVQFSSPVYPNAIATNTDVAKGSSNSAIAAMTTPLTLTVTGVVPVTIWTHVCDVYDIDIRNNQLHMDLYVTYKCPSNNVRHVAPLLHAEIIEAKKTEIELNNTEMDSNEIRESCKYRTTIKKVWDTTNFPFDRHLIRLSLEDCEDQASNLVFLVDEKSSFETNNATCSPDWVIQAIKPAVITNTWPWNESYSRYEIAFTMERRHPWSSYMKAFLPLFLAVVVSLLTLWFPANLTRFSLPVAGLFGAIASAQAVSANVGMGTTLGLADKLYILSFTVILLTLVATAVSSVRYHKNTAQNKAGAKSELFVDRVAFCILFLFYVTVVFFLTHRAAQG